MRRRGRIRQRIDPDLLHQLDCLIGAPVDLEAAHGERHRVGRRPHHEIPVGDIPVEARRQHQELAARSLVGTQRSDVGQVALQPVLDEAQHVRWRFDHRRSVVLEREMADGIDRLGVGGQQQGLGVHQLLPHHHLRRLGRPERPQSLPQCHLADRHQLRQEHLRGPIEQLQLPQPIRCVSQSGSR